MNSHTEGDFKSHWISYNPNPIACKCCEEIWSTVNSILLGNRIKFVSFRSSFFYIVVNIRIYRFGSNFYAKDSMHPH